MTRKVENIIQIDAPPAVVWAVTEDVEKWPEWTPTVTSVKRLDEGEFDVGSSALIKQPALPEAKWTVTSLTRGKQFAWETSLWGTRMVGTHAMTAVGDGTQSVLSIEMDGLTAPLLWLMARSSVTEAIAKENAGLKKRCEVRDE